MKLTKDHGFLVAAHRGDSYNFYENTMRAFELAIERGCDMVETDVRLTKDGVLVLMHDESCKRTTGVDVTVTESTYEELQKLNAGDPDEYLYCACIFADNFKENYDYLIERGIEPWVGAGVTVKEHLALCIEYSASLITTNNTSDIRAKLKEIK